MLVLSRTPGKRPLESLDMHQEIMPGVDERQLCSVSGYDNFEGPCAFNVLIAKRTLAPAGVGPPSIVPWEHHVSSIFGGGRKSTAISRVIHI